jgi:hypothetical protein
MAIPCAALAIATGAAAAASAQSLSTERLVAPRLDDWHIAYYHATDGETVRREVPRGQTAEAWQRMVTTKRLTGAATRTSPAGFVRDFAAAASKACPDARVSSTAQRPKSGRPAARVRIDCPGAPDTDGRPETTIVLAVAGRSDIHVKQVAFRGGLGSADLPWAERFLSGVALCDEGDQAPTCTR